MKAKWLWALAAMGFQVLVLGFMAGQREWIARTGTTVWLRTAPIDPRDVMRGDYVRLDYDISRVEPARWGKGVGEQRGRYGGFRAGQPVFATLRVTEDGTAELVSLLSERPKDGLFLRGRTDSSWGSQMQVRYGIEALFMQQGTAQALEDQRRGQFSGVPIRAEVAVSSGGIAVLKSYRWDSLGITIAPENTNQIVPLAVPGGGPILGINAVRVTLKNHGPEELAIVNLPGNASFALVCEANWSPASARWVGASNAPAAPRPQDVVVLKPGESRTNRLDLLDPQWFVVPENRAGANGKAVPVRDLLANSGAGFRIEYRAPDRTACDGLPDAKLIWHGRLRSRLIWPSGQVD